MTTRDSQVPHESEAPTTSPAHPSRGGFHLEESPLGKGAWRQPRGSEAHSGTVGTDVRPGQVVRLHARDAASADRDLRSALSARRQRASTTGGVITEPNPQVARSPIRLLLATHRPLIW